MGRLKNKKVLPVFNKPRIDLDKKHAKEWRNVRADELQEGDLVANLGLVIYTQTTCDEQVMIEAGYPHSREFFFTADEVLYAFVKKG